MRIFEGATLSLIVFCVVGCQQGLETVETVDSEAQTETQVFLKIDVPELKESARKHFGEVQSHGSQAKSELGGPGYMAMKGRRFQRFQIRGTITQDGREALFSQLKTDVQTVLKEKMALRSLAKSRKPFAIDPFGTC